MKLDPDSADAHFDLATAYSRSGRKQEAARQFALQKQTRMKMQQTEEKVREGITGAPPQ